MNKQIILTFSEDVDIEEVKSYVEEYISDYWVDELKLVDKIFVKQYFCEACGSQIDKEKYYNNDFLCDFCNFEESEWNKEKEDKKIKENLKNEYIGIYLI